MATSRTVLVIGATGSIGRLVVPAARAAGHTVHAGVRDLSRGASILGPDTDLTVADLQRPDTLAGAVAGVDTVILTQGVSAGGSPEEVDYIGVRNLLDAVGANTPHIIAMTALYVTRPEHFLNTQFDHVLDWRRRAERLIRASGLPYTIVRPGWFDRAEPGHATTVFEQGDTADAGVSRAQIADVLVHAITEPDAVGKTFELISGPGAADADWTAMFAALDADPVGGIDGVRDANTLPVADEPAAVQQDLGRALPR
jgi:uncharacterized protein YbjT (DUF2867 family)